APAGRSAGGATGAADAHRAAGLRADDAVGGQAVATLPALDRGEGVRTEHAVCGDAHDALHLTHVAAPVAVADVAGEVGLAGRPARGSGGRAPGAAQPHLGAGLR